MKQFQQAAMAVVIALFTATSASAALIKWDVNGTFSSGATASGTAVFDTDTLLFDNWSIDLTADSDFSATTYSNSAPLASQAVLETVIQFAGGTAGSGALAFFITGDLKTQLGNLSPIVFFAIDECRPNCGTRRRGSVASFTNPTDVSPPPIPLPAAGWMLLAGVGGLVVMKRRKRIYA